MKKWGEYKVRLIAELSTIYDESEAKTITKIISEELIFLSNKIDYYNRDFELSNQHIKELENALKHLLHKKPLQYIINKAWFYDFEFYVNENVLIPRPETEELVDLIIKENNSFKGKLLDIGTGSGCIPIALTKHLYQAKISAIDVDENAIKVAEKNAKNLEADINFINCNILDKQEQAKLNKYDIIVSNPPYIPFYEKEKMKENVLDFEPHLALFVENENPLIFYTTIADFALTHLNNNGKLYFECNEYNAKEVKSILESKAFNSVKIIKDLQGKDRMISAEKPTL